MRPLEGTRPQLIFTLKTVPISAQYVLTSVVVQLTLASYKAAASNFPVELEHLYNCGNIRDLLDGSDFSLNTVYVAVLYHGIEMLEMNVP